jgi:hypothetical protein
MSKITQEILDSYKKKEVKFHLLKVDITGREKGKSVIKNPVSISFEEWEKMQANKDDEVDEEIEQVEGVYYAILRTPGRKQLSFALSSKDQLEMGKAIKESCWETGDDEMRDIAYQDSVGMWADMQALELLSKGQTALKKI